MVHSIISTPNTKTGFVFEIFNDTENKEYLYKVWNPSGARVFYDVIQYTPENEHAIFAKILNQLSIDFVAYTGK